jgi:hypothetical protein
MNVFIDEPAVQLLLRNITQFVAVVSAYSFLLWLACEVTGGGIPKPWRTRVKLALAYVLGPLGGMALYGVGWLPLPNATAPWDWILAALTGLASTVAAERIINDTLFGRILHFWHRDQPTPPEGGGA